MPASNPVPIPFPLSTFPGANPQESSGRLINCYVEPLGEGGQLYVRRRSPGLSQHASTAQSGYRGGLAVNNLSYETWANNASTVDAGGTVTSIGTFPGTKTISIARNQSSPTPDVVAVDVDNGAYVLGSASVNPATATATVQGSSIVAGCVLDITFLNAYISDFPVALTYTVLSADTLSTIATAFAALINANATLTANHVSATAAGAVITIDHQGTIGNSTSLTFGIAGGTPNAGNETVTFNPTSGNVVSGSVTATIGGASLVFGDIVNLTFKNTLITAFPVTVSHTLGTAETTTTIATALTTEINANTVLTAAGVSATSAAAVITISQTGGSSTSTFVSFSTGQVGNLEIVFAPTSGDLSGGTGTFGAFVGGVPTLYNGQGNMPSPNSVCFQDGYFFFTIGNGQVYATPLNSLTMNALTFITVQAKSDVNLLRGIAFSGLLFLFTTGSCEIWQDAALPAPNFPYSRILVLEFGLIQSAAIAGWDTGFSQLMWVAQDYGVYWLQPGSTSPIKASPSDLDRLIGAEVRAGNTLVAGCYIFAGKKFWHLSSPNWSWEFNLETQKWNERWSLNSSGIFGRWRAVCGHPAFGKWLVGDTASGNLLWIDNTNFTENGAVLLTRLESSPVKDFPNQIRIARADFDFVMGVGIAVGNFSMQVMGAVSGTGGVVRLTVNSTAQAKTNDTVVVSGVTGTTEANGTWLIIVIDATHIELKGTVFVHSYVSGGTAIDITSPPNAISPTVAISMSKDGGLNWGNPLIRQLGTQANSLRARASVKSMGLSGTMGDRWRLDVTDPVYVAFLGGTQSSDPRAVGT